MALRIARTLATKGYVIVSGLARGTDEWAHFGALKANGGRTVAVLPWMDPIYPPEHAELLSEIERRGAVVSEHPTQVFWKSARGKFVERNRITSGLSKCVIAVESDEAGGTVHQVELALAQGKKVFAVVPKSQRAKRGFELFLKKGAVALRSVDGVLEYLTSIGSSVEQRMEAFYPNPQEKLGTSDDKREDSL
jgi:DNA processing protein